MCTYIHFNVFIFMHRICEGTRLWLLVSTLKRFGAKSISGKKHLKIWSNSAYLKGRLLSGFRSRKPPEAELILSKGFHRFSTLDNQSRFTPDPPNNSYCQRISHKVLYLKWLGIVWWPLHTYKIGRYNASVKITA